MKRSASKTSQNLGDPVSARSAWYEQVIAGTDLQILRGYAGFAGVPGHEFLGIVEEAPDADAPHPLNRRDLS